MNVSLKFASLALGALLAGNALANGAGDVETTTVQTAQGPLTVHWGQPATVPNIADYQVRIEDLDRDGDGMISRSEVPASHALNFEFKLVDRNRNGLITAAELAAWR